MSKPELLILTGLPASGKSTHARAWQQEDPDGRIRVNWDEARRARYGPDWIWNRPEEEQMKAAVRSTVVDALKAGLSVVVDNVNLSRHVRASWLALATDLGAEYVEEEIPTPLHICVARDRLRGPARVGQAVIDGMALEYGLVDWWDERSVVRGTYHTTSPRPRPIAIVDIDGTLADDSHRLGHLEAKLIHTAGCTSGCDCGHLVDGAGHPAACPARNYDKGECPQCGAKLRKNWGGYFAEVSNDIPIKGLVGMLERLNDHLIILVSGRPTTNGAAKVGIMTEDWLLQHGVPFDLLFLKTRNFHQRGVDFKRAILEHLPRERVAYVFENSTECARMYREELAKIGKGAIVMQVAEEAR